MACVGDHDMYAKMVKDVRGTILWPPPPTEPHTEPPHVLPACLGDHDKCMDCATPFIKKDLKSYNRKRVLLMTTAETAKKVFPGTSPTEKSFLCPACTKILFAKTVKKGTKRVWPPTPPTRPPVEPPYKKNKTNYPKVTSYKPPQNSLGRPCSVAAVAELMMKGRYKTAFRRVLGSKTKAKSALLGVVAETIMKERKRMEKDKDGPFIQKVCPENLELFSWEKVLLWAEEIAPTLALCLKAMFNIKPSKEPPSSSEDDADDDGKQLIARRAGFILSITLYKSRDHKFVQGSLGVQLWRQGCPSKVFKTLNSLGVCLGDAASRNLVDSLRLDYDKEVLLWKSEIENRPRRRRVVITKAGELLCKEYSLTWDRLQVAVNTQSNQREKKALTWALLFATQNKVDFCHLKGQPIPAVAVNPFSILPTPEVFFNLRKRMEVIVMRILVDHWPILEDLASDVMWHVPHVFSEAMNASSKIVSLGVIQENPGTNPGVLKIMEHIQNYVPIVRGEPVPILCYGDGGAVDRMVHAKKAKRDGEDALARLEGLQESPQEFHRECMSLQDYVDRHLSRASEASTGTLYHLKEFFQFRSLVPEKRVVERAHAAADMLLFATSAYTVLLAITLCGVTGLSSIPPGFPMKNDEQLLWLKVLCEKIVDFCWMPPDQGDINAAAYATSRDDIKDSVEFPFCQCQEDTGEDVVLCCSASCKYTQMHLSCAGLSSGPDGDWFCSADCDNSGTYIYCSCKLRQGGKMFQCYNKDKCLKNEWYHEQCLSDVQKEHLGAKAWYCSEECTNGTLEQDYKLNYSKSLLWDGLFILSCKDAVLEGDGIAIKETWQVDMVNFWSQSHPKYFQNGHRMLTGIGGFLPERLQQDLIWNRVVNINGEPGGNMGMDSVNKVLNKDLKEMLSHPPNKYTERQVARCAELGGAFGQMLDSLFIGAGLPMGITNKQKTLAEDVRHFVENFQTESLFDYLPGREHIGFERFQRSTKLKDPHKMGMKIRELWKDMDKGKI